MSVDVIMPNTILIGSPWLTFLLVLFSYVRDATAAMFIAFSLFIFPSQRPRIFAPDGSGEPCLITEVPVSVRKS